MQEGELRQSLRGSRGDMLALLSGSTVKSDGVA